MLMDPCAGAVHADPPVHFAGRVGLGQEPHQDLVPHPAARKLRVPTPSCSSPGRELIADVQRISTDEADSRSCFSLDGEGLELARDM